jgi:kynureninase
MDFDAALKLDADDELAPFRERFVTDGDVVAYLDGNSLGRLPRSTARRLSRLVDEEWGDGLIRSWKDWADLPVRTGDRLAQAVLGAGEGQTVIADSTTVNLFKVLDAAAGLRPHRRELVIDQANFPTDRYVVEAVAAARGMDVRWIPPDPAGGVTPDALAAHVGPQSAAVVLSHVDYRTGYLVDMAALDEVIHGHYALAVWDLSHAAGSVPIHLDDDGADFAVGCTYKYLNAGPGAPAFLYAARRHHADARQPIPGWFGADDIFAMAPRYQPGDGARRMLSGTPAVLGVAAVAEGVELVAEAGIDRIRAKGIALTEMARQLADQWLEPLGWHFASPTDPARRGSHVVIAGSGAEAVVARMIGAGAIPDFRHPDLVRIGLSPLTTSFAELWKGMELMAQAVRETTG